MSIAQRVILAIAAIFMLVFAFSTAVKYDANEWPATAQFIIAVALLVFAARRSSSSNP